MKKNLPVILFVSIIIACSGWGFLIHRTIHQLAVYQLPKSIQPFFYSNMDYLVKHSVRPDLRRNKDKTEDTKHFIDFEAYGDSAAWKMPLKWDLAVIKYSKDTLLKYGYVPYHVIAMKKKLTNAFKAKNKDSILFYAADIGHYIADANVPLHTTLNYDGQLTNQKGLHSLWESMIPEIELSQYDLSTKHKARYLSKPDEAIWNAVRQSHLLLKNVLQMETQASKNFTDATKYRVQMRNGKESRSYTSNFAKAYSKLLGNTINQQLLKTSNLISDFWFTSWVDAGKPDLKGLLKEPFSEEDSHKLKTESKSFKANELLKDNLLIAKKPVAGSEQ